MNVRQLLGALVILGAYGLTWYLLLKSLAIVKIIDREGLRHCGEIKGRLRRKGSAGEAGFPPGSPPRSKQS